MNINNKSNMDRDMGISNNSLNILDNRSINSNETSNATSSVKSINSQNNIINIFENIRSNSNIIEQELLQNQNKIQSIQNNTQHLQLAKQFFKVYSDGDYDDEFMVFDSQLESAINGEAIDNNENDQSNGGIQPTHSTQTLGTKSTLFTNSGNIDNDNWYQDIVGSTFDFKFSETKGRSTPSIPDYHNYNIGGASSTTSNTFNGQFQPPYKRYKFDRSNASPTVYDKTNNDDSFTNIIKEAFSSGFDLLDIPELLKINKEYQDHIKKCLATIEFEQSRNKEMLEKAKRYEKVKLSRHKGIPINSDSGVDEDFILNPSGRKKTNGDPSNYQHHIGLAKDVHSIHSVYRSKDKKPGIPFFSFEKQVDGVTLTINPDNPDSIYDRQTRGIMRPFFKVDKWTKKESEILAKGVKVIDVLVKNKIQKDNDSCTENSKTSNADQDQTLTIDDFTNICKQGLARTPSDAFLRWKNHGDPSINKKPFTKEEDKKLLLLAKKYGGHEWVTIATELGTNRTPLICFQRFRRSLDPNIMKKDWTREEDKNLRTLVEYQIKKNVTRIDWQDVARNLIDRTGIQCLHRWYKTLDPTIRRGRWNEDEDACLLKAVELYGKGNWILIKEHVKGRTDVQCRERYCNVLDPLLVKNQFTKEEDARLIQVTKEIGIGKWSKISKVIGKTDNQCWRRWKQLNKGTSELLEHISIADKKKKICRNNFAGRNKERSSLTVDDMLAVDAQFKQQIENENLTNNANTTNNNNNININSISQLPTTEPHFQLPQPTQPAQSTQPTFMSFQNNISETIVINFNVDNIMYRSNTTSNNLSFPHPTPPINNKFQFNLNGDHEEKLRF